jgi:hypothetical protein
VTPISKKQNLFTKFVPKNKPVESTDFKELSPCSVWYPLKRQRNPKGHSRMELFIVEINSSESYGWNLLTF